MVTYFLHIITITTISIMMITILITMANAGTAVSDWLLLVISRLLQLTVPPLTLKKTRDNDEDDEDDEDGDAYSFPTFE